MLFNGNWTMLDIQRQRPAILRDFVSALRQRLVASTEVFASLSL